MLRSPDSWSAVASAMVTARSGSPRAVPTAVIVAAFTACSGVNSYVAPSPPAETTSQAGSPGTAGDVLHREIARDGEQDQEGRPTTEEAATTRLGGGRLRHPYKVLESRQRGSRVG